MATAPSDSEARSLGIALGTDKRVILIFCGSAREDFRVSTANRQCRIRRLFWFLLGRLRLTTRSQKSEAPNEFGRSEQSIAASGNSPVGVTRSCPISRVFLGKRPSRATARSASGKACYRKLYCTSH